MAIEMTGDDNEKNAPPPPPTGITVRAWYGVELVSPLTLSQPHRTQPSSIVSVGRTSRGRTNVGHFIAVENTPARTLAEAA